MAECQSFVSEERIKQLELQVARLSDGQGKLFSEIALVGATATLGLQTATGASQLATTAQAIGSKALGAAQTAIAKVTPLIAIVAAIAAIVNGIDIEILKRNIAKVEDLANEAIAFASANVTRIEDVRKTAVEALNKAFDADATANTALAKAIRAEAKSDLALAESIAANSAANKAENAAQAALGVASSLTTKVDDALTTATNAAQTATQAITQAIANSAAISNLTTIINNFARGGDTAVTTNVTNITNNTIVNNNFVQSDSATGNQVNLDALKRIEAKVNQNNALLRGGVIVAGGQIEGIKNHTTGQITRSTATINAATAAATLATQCCPVTFQNQSLLQQVAVTQQQHITENRLHASLTAINRFWQEEFLQNFNSWKQTATDFYNKTVGSDAFNKAVNYMNLVLNIHNAAMLSREVGETALDALSNGLSAIGINDADGNPIDIAEKLGSSFQSLMRNILGTENYASLSSKWRNASRIYQAGANILNTVHDIIDSTRTVVETTGEYVGQIGNALRRSGAVFEDAYDEMEEKFDQVNSTKSRFQKLYGKLEDAEDAFGSVDTIAGSVLNIQQSLEELEENRDEFNQSVQTARTTRQQEQDEIVLDSEASVDFDETDVRRAGQ